MKSSSQGCIGCRWRLMDVKPPHDTRYIELYGLYSIIARLNSTLGDACRGVSHISNQREPRRNAAANSSVVPRVWASANSFQSAGDGVCIMCVTCVTCLCSPVIVCQGGEQMRRHPLGSYHSDVCLFAWAVGLMLTVCSSLNGADC